MQDDQHVVIIGNGISGITAARHIRKMSSRRITVISGESDYFYSRTALMYVYMGHMEFRHTQPYENWFWRKNEIELVKDWVKQIDFEQKCLKLADSPDLQYDQLIIATGSVSNKFGWPGQDAKGVSGLYNIQDLEYIEEHTKDVNKAAIVGGGLIGIELAEMLHSRKIEVTFLVREENFWDIVLPTEEAKMINKEILDHDIDLRLATELQSIETNNAGQVTGVITKDNQKIDCQFVGLTVGVSPNVAWLKDSPLEINRGIVVNEYLETNMPDVYAVGDCAEHKAPMEGRRPIEQVWYTGRMMGEVVARTVADKRTAYKPGVWFNSAKFFNIEYQTYGTVLPEPDENQDQFVWQADDGKHLLRIVFDKSTHVVMGVNVFGIRMRHEVWNDWISEKQTIDQVMAKLERANFDPEFYRRYEFEIREEFNLAFPSLAVDNTRPSLLKRLFA